MTTRITIVDLAEELGVSRQTISNVLNAPHRVKEATRLRVEKRIAESGYRPNSAARQLRNHKSMNLGMRLPRASDGINGAVLDGFLYSLTEAAQAHGYRLTLFCADTDQQEMNRFEELLSVAELDGFVLTGTDRDDERPAWLAERGVPFVAFGRPWGTEAGSAESAHSWVDVDGSSGVRDATEHFIAQGHRRIGFIGWPEDSAVGDDRRNGWLDAMTSHFPAEEWTALSYLGDDSAKVGSSGAAELLAQGVTALVCASDSLALGASSFLRQSPIPGLASSVIGFDNTPVAAALGLSSVSQPVADVAAEVMRLLLRQFSRTAMEPENSLLRPRLEIRNFQSFNR
ncbi:LacI family DNA-binding transcriptional regulator [Arthrobacter sp. NA-172]|uniref:LacI family DNA-binding transcriptional regulator n=1 Tax=Arthrobacter sp. NA-172 TaxID=3367524 RepID=UPI0037543CB8